MTKQYFISVCSTLGINPTKAAKIINGRYKPYLSAIDDNYYSGNDVWDAKTNALQSAVRNMGVGNVVTKLNRLR